MEDEKYWYRQSGQLTQGGPQISQSDMERSQKAQECPRTGFEGSPVNTAKGKGATEATGDRRQDPEKVLRAAALTTQCVAKREVSSVFHCHGPNLGESINLFFLSVTAHLLRTLCVAGTAEHHAEKLTISLLSRGRLRVKEANIDIPIFINTMTEMK